MGVPYLWKIVGPAGRRREMRQLCNKRLAVDMSIWLHQFASVLHTMQAKPSSDSTHAFAPHLRALFHRLAKMMFWHIQPVFVFDGGVPALKRNTVGKRRARAQEVVRAQERELLMIAAKAALQSYQNQGNGNDDDAAASATPSKMVDLRATHNVYAKLRRMQEANDPMFVPPINDSNVAGGGDGKSISNVDAAKGEEKGLHEGEDESVPVDYRLSDAFFDALLSEELNTSELSSLPPLMQYELLLGLKEKRASELDEDVVSMLSGGQDANDFSSAQLRKLKKASHLTRKLETVKASLKSSLMDGMQGEIMASDGTTVLMLVDGAQPSAENNDNDNNKHKHQHNVSSHYALPQPIGGGGFMPDDDDSDDAEGGEELPVILPNSPAMRQPSPALPTISSSQNQPSPPPVEKEDTIYVTLPTTSLADNGSDAYDSYFDASSSEEEGNRNTEKHFVVETELSLNNHKNKEAVEGEIEPEPESERDNVVMPSPQPTNATAGSVEESSADEEEVKAVEMEIEDPVPVERELEEEEVVVQEDIPEVESALQSVCHMWSGAPAAPSQSLSTATMSVVPTPMKSRLTSSAADITAEMIDQCKTLLHLFGVPFVIAPMEAEAQCVALEQAGLVEGIITNDSDTLLFGGKHIFRHVFDRHSDVEFYDADLIQEELGLSRQHMIHLALLLGSDYTEGIAGVGQVGSLEIVRNFERLEDFVAWHQGTEPQTLPTASAILQRKRGKLNLPPTFPSATVQDAYLQPSVSHFSESETLTWRPPQREGLLTYAREVLAYSEKDAIALVGTVLEGWRPVQRTISDFFPPLPKAPVSNRRKRKAPLS
jgi:5'-3' exonuclease